MSCVPIPDFPPLPDISPFSISPPALPPLDLSIDFCCRLALVDFVPSIPLGPAIVAIPGASAVIAAINESLAVIDAYIDAIPLKCPRQP